MPESLDDLLMGSPYRGYAYAYPHKMAYRPFAAPLRLADLWRGEDREALYFYAHIPFCEMRCGFCNLFTTANPKGDLPERYLDALDAEMAAFAEETGRLRFARGAIGGGTPTFLTARQLSRLFDQIDARLGGLGDGTPLSCEMSPATAEGGRLGVLRERGVTRASIGVQSFVESETREMGRPQDPAVARRAIEAIRAAGFPVLNIDLIYGTAGQTVGSWRRSVGEAAAFQAEEIYLYPLYVRPLTGLDRLGREPADHRPALYLAGRDLLLEGGYRQVSMRLFRRAGAPIPVGGPDYCCQEDGMAGFGSGARSYTRAVHYSTEYAVGRGGIQEIIEAYLRASPADRRAARYGCLLDDAEQRRRYAIKSILRADGLDLDRYADQFGREAPDDFPELAALESRGLAARCGRRIAPTARGLEWSDAIGPWLYSEAMKALASGFKLA